MICLDTHAVVWLHAGEIAKFSQRALSAMSVPTLYISPMVTLEVQFLREIGRITDEPKDILQNVAQRFGVTVLGDIFENVTERALMLPWTRDPFDRLIVAHADLHSADLVTRDANIGQNYARAIW